eukprot:TRINITY_DN12404_c0_g1_i4.p1 TRINITY_DN12404_c0_g1~~TRINITY_DN12404_c0_g1_i4.p1  ORF type:complete len:115 (-),score=25.74 TRINITY_DN12404_c0_g1_i4:314-658(-)
METETKARGLIRKTCSVHLLDLINENQTVPQAMEILKEMTSIVNGSAIKMYSEAMWNMQVDSLENRAEHFGQFEQIVVCLQANNSCPSEEAVKEAFTNICSVILPTLQRPNCHV